MNIAWVIIVTIIVIIVQSYMYNYWGPAKIRYNRSFSRSSVFEGEDIEMIDTISNNKLLPLPWLRLESKISKNLEFRSNHLGSKDDDGEFHRTLFSLMPYQKITRRHKLTCVQRGYYALNTVSMSTGDVFGFAQIFKSYDATAYVTVYPKIISLSEIPLPSHSWLGDISVRRWIIEDPFVLAGIREYTDRDALNTVNWKATARTGKLQVNQKDFTADHHLMIYVNFDQTDDIWLPIEDEARIEKGLSYAASIANEAISKGVSTGFGCNGYLVEPFTQKENDIKQSVRIEPNSSNQQLTYLLDTMAKLKIDRTENFNYFLTKDIDEQLTNNDILIITCTQTEEMECHIRELENLGNAVEVLLIEADEQAEYINANEEIGEIHAQ